MHDSSVYVFATCTSVPSKELIFSQTDHCICELFCQLICLKIFNKILIVNKKPQSCWTFLGPPAPCPVLQRLLKMRYSSWNIKILPLQDVCPPSFADLGLFFSESRIRRNIPSWLWIGSINLSDYIQKTSQTTKLKHKRFRGHVMMPSFSTRNF